MSSPIAIVRAAACGAMGADIAAMVESLRTDRCGVGPSDVLEQVPAVAAGVGQVPLGNRPGASADTARAEHIYTTAGVKTVRVAANDGRGGAVERDVTAFCAFLQQP